MTRAYARTSDPTSSDEAAMAALTGLLADSNIILESAVTAAYRAADLMLKARENG